MTDELNSDHYYGIIVCERRPLPGFTRFKMVSTPYELNGSSSLVITVESELSPYGNFKKKITLYGFQI